MARATPRKAREDGTTVLYRLFDADSKLLYVGISHHPRTRFGQHAADKPWWPDVVNASFDWYSTRAEAMLREQIAIENEAPLHNTKFRPESPPLPPGGHVNSMEWYRLCDAYRSAYKALAAAVVAEAEKGTDLSRIARSVDWTREYIGKIRKAREGKLPPE